MRTERIITEGIVEILELHAYRGSELACECGQEGLKGDEHRQHVAEKLAVNIDYWFGLKRFMQ